MIPPSLPHKEYYFVSEKCTWPVIHRQKFIPCLMHENREL